MSKNNEKGFSTVELLLIIVIVALIGTVGYFVYKDQHPKVKTVTVTKTVTAPRTSSNKTSSSTTSNPYAGWNTYQLKIEKITFKYPSSWTLKDNSDSNNDYIQLTGSNNFVMSIGAGADVSAVNYPYGGSTVVQADPITFTSQPGYVDLWSDTGTTTGNVFAMWLSQSKTDSHDFFPSKNITTNASTSSVVALMNYNASNSTSYNGEPLSYVLNDINYKEGRLVISSMSY